MTVLLATILLAGVALADTSYTVQSGDTLSGIAARHGVTIEAIMAANGLQSRSTIYAGQVLKIPSPASQNPSPTSQPQQTQQPQGTPAGEQTYTVQTGDSLTRVAALYGVTVQALAAANNIAPNAFLYV